LKILLIGIDFCSLIGYSYFQEKARTLSNAGKRPSFFVSQPLPCGCGAVQQNRILIVLWLFLNPNPYPLKNRPV